MGIPVKVYYKVDRLLTGLTAQQIGTTAQWYSNKTPLFLHDNSKLKLFHYQYVNCKI